MRPIMLKGHERSITFLKYNREGDLLFTCSKDTTPTLWYSHDGERIGTYGGDRNDGHSGSVWSLDVTADTRLLITASADQTVKLWEVMTGKEMLTFPHKGPVKAVAFALGDKEFVTATDYYREHPVSLSVYDFTGGDLEEQPTEPKLVIADRENPRRRITQIGYLALNRGIVVCYHDGSLRVYHPGTGEELYYGMEHEGSINALAFNAERTVFVTASSDQTAKMWIASTEPRVIRTYESNTPLNAASLSPIKEHLIIGGGQDAGDVTKTAAGAGKFEARIFKTALEEEWGRVKGHFGPLNTASFHPDGRSFATGGEDGYVRINHFDPSYFSEKADEEEGLLDDPYLEGLAARPDWDAEQDEEDADAFSEDDEDVEGDEPVAGAGAASGSSR